jgi:hypothetical protein
LETDQKSVIVYTVPYYNFDSGWKTWQQFKWKNDRRPPSKKRRSGASNTDHTTAATAATRNFNDAEKSSARDSLRQFVLAFTLSKDASEKPVPVPRTATDADEEGNKALEAA